MPSTTPHTLLALKVATKSKSISDKQASDRQRDCLVLILSFLCHFGYVQTAAQLQSEAGKILSRFESADNIDLTQIVTEYEYFYEMKFKRKPKFSRPSQSDRSSTGIKSNNSGSSTNANTNARRSRHASQVTSNGQIRTTGRAGSVNRLLPHLEPSSPSKAKKLLLSGSGNGNGNVKGNTNGNDNDNSSSNAVKSREDNDKHMDKNMLHIHGKRETRERKQNSIPTNSNRDHNNHNQQEEYQHQSTGERIIKPLPSFGDNFELRALASSIQSEILDESPGVSWDDIVALEDAKRLLKEAVVLPIQYPELFSGLLVPWRGVLLYGPPGTGKTLLAKAVATESETTFFNISASSIVSKFRGDSEKLIKVLFDLARYHAPSTIFIDEIDSIMGHRGCGSSNAGGSEGNEHEGSRRMKTELLIEMDGLGSGGQHVFVLAASNMPWDLDPALLRRLEKRIVVPMPNEEARKRLLKKYLSLHTCRLEEKDFDQCALKTEGYNGSDIKLLCKEAAMRPVRSIFIKMEKLRMKESESSKGVKRSEKHVLDVKALLEKHPVIPADLMNSLASTKPSTDLKLSQKYVEWSISHGAI